MVFTESVTCPSLHAQFLDLFECTNITLPFCILPSGKFTLWHCHLILHIVFLAGRTVGSSQCRVGLCLHHRWNHVRRATGRGRDSHEASRRCSYGHRDRKRHRRRGAAESVARGLVGHLQSGRLQHAKQTLILWALYPLDMLVRSSLHTTEIETHRMKEDAAPLVYT